MVQEWSWARRLFRHKNLLTLHKVSGFHESLSPSELCGYFTGVAQLAAVLLWSHGRAWEDVCCVVSVLPSHKAEAYLGPASARSGELDLACPMGFLLIPWRFPLGRAIHPAPSARSNQAKRRASSLWWPFHWRGLGAAFGFNYPVSFSACLNFDWTGWAGCLFPWNKVLHPSWESAQRPQEQ